MAGIVPMISWVPLLSTMTSDMGFFADELENPEGVLQHVVQEAVIPEIEHQFNVGGDPPWQHLSDDTLVRKMQQGFSSEPLIATGEMRSVYTSLDPWEFQGEEAIMYSLPGTEYSWIHQEGGVNVPARPFAVMGDEALDRVVDAAVAYMESQGL
jgi:phage gpG-like protein